MNEFVSLIPGSAMVGLSSCPDEVNRDLELALSNKIRAYYREMLQGKSKPSKRFLRGRVFHLGGLSGFPFTGFTGVKVFLEHCTKQGATEAWIVVCSHIGRTSKREFGRVERGKVTDWCCGSALSALFVAIAEHESGERPPAPRCCDDHQQQEIQGLVAKVWKAYVDLPADSRPLPIEKLIPLVHRFKKRKLLAEEHEPVHHLLAFVADQLARHYYTSVELLVDNAALALGHECPEKITIVAGVQVNFEDLENPIQDRFFTVKKGEIWRSPGYGAPEHSQEVSEPKQLKKGQSERKSGRTPKRSK